MSNLALKYKRRCQKCQKAFYIIDSCKVCYDCHTELSCLLKFKKKERILEIVQHQAPKEH